MRDGGKAKGGREGGREEGERKRGRKAEREGGKEGERERCQLFAVYTMSCRQSPHIENGKGRRTNKYTRHTKLILILLCPPEGLQLQQVHWGQQCARRLVLILE